MNQRLPRAWYESLYTPDNFSEANHASVSATETVLTRPQSQGGELSKADISPKSPVFERTIVNMQGMCDIVQSL